MPSAGSPNGRVTALLTLENGETVIGGMMTSLTSRTLDAAFDALGTGCAAASVNGGLRLIPERTATGGYTGNTILLHGCAAFDGKAVPYGITRIGVDGRIDATFNAGGQGVPVQESATDGLAERAPDGTYTGKFIVIGYLRTYNGVTIPLGMLRLNADGSRDASFNPGGAGGYPQAVAQELSAATGLPTGALYVSSYSRTFNGVTHTDALFRLDADGKVDPTFNPSLGCADAVGTSFPELTPTGASGSSSWSAACRSARSTATRSPRRSSCVSTRAAR
jgi:hypothetical protein